MAVLKLFCTALRHHFPGVGLEILSQFDNLHFFSFFLARLKEPSARKTHTWTAGENFVRKHERKICFALNLSRFKEELTETIPNPSKSIRPSALTKKVIVIEGPKFNN